MNITIPGRVPSKKNSKRIFRRGGRTIVLPSEGYERWKKQALKVIKKKLIPSPYYVTYIFRMKGKARSDLDNMIASVNDVLQDAGVLDDDNNILEIEASKQGEEEEYKTEIFIETLESEC